MNEVLYSVLWFAPRIESNVVNTVKRYIMTGKKVFLLSFEGAESIITDDYLKLAKNKKLLSVYHVPYKKEIDEELIILDGSDMEHPYLRYFDDVCAFNLPQYRLEHDISGTHSLVKAGAGTGKTSTMINRISFLKHVYENGVDLRGFVLITFTNEASVHMRATLMEKFKDYYELTRDMKYLEWLEEMGDMFIGTIHAFASHFFSKEGKSLGFAQMLEIRSYRHEVKRQIGMAIDLFANEHPEIYQTFKWIPHYQMERLFADMIAHIQHKALSFREVQNILYGSDDRKLHIFVEFIVRTVSSNLQMIKKRDGTLEVHDLISRLDEVRNLNESNLKLPLTHLFVDEFQDTDEAQVMFVSWLASSYPIKLLVVGDIKQSIYRFRGADYTAFTQLTRRLEAQGLPFNTYSLRKNYRSSPLLLNQLNRLFEKWDDKIGRFNYEESDRLEPGLLDDKGAGLTTMRMDDYVLKVLLRRLYGKDAAFLVRSNRQAKEMVKRIEEAGFFCESNLTGAFYRSVPVREFYMLVRRYTHPKVPKDRMAFHHSSYGEDSIQAMEWINHSHEEKNMVVDRLDLIEKSKMIPKDQNALQWLEELINNIDPATVYRKRFYQHKRTEVPDQDINVLKKEAVLRYEEYKINLEQLLFILKKTFGDTSASLYDIENFLRIKMTTDRLVNEWKKSDDKALRFKVMTVHGAKGLEFEHVVLPMTEMAFLQEHVTGHLLFHQEGVWQYGYDVKWRNLNVRNNLYASQIGDENLETIGEETRLLYVALTRAKHTIFINGSDSLGGSRMECWNDLIESGEKLNVQRSLL